jgi:alpha-1,3-mannosyltransferase
MGLLCCSKRLHSIFLLRLFNDGPAMLLLYGSVYLFTRHHWDLGCVLYSFAVSIKMNVLLFAPGLLLLLLQASPDWKSVLLRLAVGCALPQLALGYPFLSTFPMSYLRKAFELDRVFFYQWTVNWKV